MPEETSKQLFFKALKGEKTTRTPLWIMRQAGRYLPQYQELRKKYNFWQMCTTPELAREVTLQPIYEFGLDAAIIFSDILLPLADYGLEIKFPEQGGIEILNKTNEEYYLCRGKSAENIQATLQALELTKKEINIKNLNIPLIGFAGAPWTVSEYILQKGSAKQKKGEYSIAKITAWSNPSYMEELLDSITEMTIDYLSAQIRAGADVIQLFDTNAGTLTPDDFAKWVAPYYKKIFSRLPSNTPKILFVKNAVNYSEFITSVGADALSIDWTQNPEKLWNRLSSHKDNTIKCLQGNLDPLLLTLEINDKNTELLKEKIENIISEMRNLSCGHIFNLGHGITPEAHVQNVRTLRAVTKPNS